MKKRRFIYAIVILAILGGVGFFVWKKYTSVNEPLLDNRQYKFELDSLKTLRASLMKQHAGKEELRLAFIKGITKKIFPYWYGTKWDFNGTTEMPNEGSIACGYFVTTTLRDMGVPINRVKMAQCASEEMIKSLAEKENIHRFSNVDVIIFDSKLKKLGEGLYVIGLDNHTGFIWVSKEGNFFIHSSGNSPYKVMKQKVIDSGILARSKYRVLGKISDDEGFLKKWAGT